jgi:hypothetical protein
MDVPSELASLKQWCLWRDESGRKVPYQPSGQHAKTNDATTWHTLAECQAVADQYTGLGFVFAADDPYCGIDLDGVWRDGEVADWAAPVLESLAAGYQEISPSGRGVKVWVRARVPDGRGRKVQVADGQGIEVYDRGRYFAFTGRSLDQEQTTIGDCQAAVDAILARFWPAPAASHTAPVSIPSGDVPARAVKYLERVSPAVSGQGGHGQTIRVAAILVRGFCLPVEQALQVIQSWNARCEPPWSERELLHKLTDADKRDGERGWLLNGRAYNGPDVELGRLLASLSGGEEAAAEDDLDEYADESKDPGPFPKDCLRPPGLISDIIDYNLRTAIYPQPVLALAGALAVMGVITGRKIRSQRDTRTNVMLLVLAPTGAGKDHARNVCKRVLIAANCSGMIGQDRITSHAGIISQLASSQSSLLQPDEFHTTIDSACHGRNAPHLKHIPEILKEAYSSAVTPLWKPSGYGDRKFNVEIDQPHLVLHATGVGSEFWEACTQELVTGGVIGRMILFEVGNSYAKPADISVEEPSHQIVNGLTWWRDYHGDGNLFAVHPRPVIIEEDADARSRLFGHMETIREKQIDEANIRSALWARSGQKTGQLALIFAASRQTGQKTMTIAKQDVDLAIRLNNWSTRKLAWHCEAHMADSQYRKLVNRLIGVITKNGITKSEWTRKTYGLAERNTREKILTDALEAGHVQMVEIKTKTKTKNLLKRVGSGESFR